MNGEPDAPEPARRLAGRVEDLDRAGVLVVPLARAHPRIVREALVVRTAAGEPRAYLNECKHLPIPLDAGSRQFFDPGKTALMCGTHGALFRLEDGRCFAGPCRGDSLRALEITCAPDGTLWVTDPGTDPAERPLLRR